MAWHLSCILVLHIAVIIISQSPFVSSQNNTGKFSVGQSLLADSHGSSVLSQSGDFAFGFHQFTDSSNLFLLSIWYAKIPATIVWYANGGNAVAQGSKVTITADDGLILSDPTGAHLWNTSAQFSSRDAVSYGFMSDTGNFVLKSRGNDNIAVWESFKFPTDTLLPSQVLEQGTEVTSRMWESNFTKGRFQLRFQDDGNFVLYTRDVTTDLAYSAYYASGTYNAGNNPGNVGKLLVYNESGDIYILKEDGSEFDLVSDIAQLVSTKDYYQRVTLDYNGVLNWYSYPKASAGDSGVDWHQFQSLPSNICQRVLSVLGSGACGYNSICSIDDHQQPICTCPPDYSLIDPVDVNGSCEPDFKPDVCEKGVAKGEYRLIQLDNTDWPLADYAKLDPCTEEECKTSCLNDCFCSAVIYDGISSCWKKKLPLSNGRHDSEVARTAWLKVGN